MMAETLIFSLPIKANWRCYTAVLIPEDAIVSTGSMLIAEGIAQLGLDATKTEYRGRGANKALLRRRLADAAEAGCHTVFAALGECEAEHFDDAKASFVKRANAICEESLSGLADAFRDEAADKKGKVDPQTLQAEFVSEQLVPALKAEISRIRGLGVPSGDEDQVDAFFAELEEIIDSAESDPQEFLQQKDPYAEAEELAQDYGFSSCPLTGGIY